jgi:hypothetical protein
LKKNHTYLSGTIPGVPITRDIDTKLGSVGRTNHAYLPHRPDSAWSDN